MKKNWKQFWTLNRHHAEGFTLVELIVVIAILAILSAVAIPAYSGYINKTHMTTDQKLVSEVADALQLFYYANPNAGAAWVVLAPEGGVLDANENGDKAMTDVFGAEWRNTVSLSYKGWANEMPGMTADEAAAVRGSSFLQGSTRDELLTNVANLTTAASGFVGERLNNPMLFSAMANNFGTGTDDFADMCQQYGINVEGEGDNRTFANDVNETQLSNLMVAAAAKSFTSGTNNTASNMVLEYARYTAAVNSPTATQADRDRYNAMNEAFKGANRVSEVQAALDTFRTESGALIETWETSDQADTDGAAILAIMNAINDASGNLTADDIKNGNLFTSGKVANQFNAYISAAEAMETFGVAFPNGVPADSIGLFLNIENGVPNVSSTNAEAHLQNQN